MTENELSPSQSASQESGQSTLFIVPDPTPNARDDLPFVMLQYPHPSNAKNESITFAIKPKQLEVCMVMDFHWKQPMHAIIWSDDTSRIYLVFSTEQTRAHFLNELPKRNLTQFNLERDFAASCFLRWPVGENDPCEIFRVEGSRETIMCSRLEQPAFAILGPRPYLLPFCLPYKELGGVGQARNVITLKLNEQNAGRVFRLICRNSNGASGLRQSIRALVSRTVHLGREILMVHTNALSPVLLGSEDKWVVILEGEKTIGTLQGDELMAYFDRTIQSMSKQTRAG